MITFNGTVDPIVKLTRENDLKDGETYFGTIRGFHEALFLRADDRIVVLWDPTGRPCHFLLSAKEMVNVKPFNITITATRPC